MAKFTIAKWRKEAIKMYGTSRGLDSRQRAAVTAVVHGRTKRPRKTRRAKPIKRRKKKPVARKKRRKSSFGLRGLFKLARMAAFVAPIGHEFVYHAKTGDHAKGMKAVVSALSGFDMDQGKFVPSRLLLGWGPYALTSLVTYGIGKVNGIIRRL